MVKCIKLYLLFLLLPGLRAFGQMLNDHKLASYNDNETPYPLYAGSFGMDLKFSESDIHLLAENFDALYGSWHLNQQTADQIKAINPDFDFQAYHGNWRVGRRDIAYIENGHLDDILYYRLGNLATDISESATELLLEDVFGSILPSTAHPDSLRSYWTEKELKFVTFLKIGDEYLRIQKVDGDKLTVIRGFSGSKAKAFPRGTPVLTPVYGKAYDPGIKQAYEYRQDERSMLRWNRLLNVLKADYEKHGGGIWIDILIGNLSRYTAAGETVSPERIWDLEGNQVYDPAIQAKNAEKGINYIQEQFFKEYHKYPVIWGNNMMFPIDSLNNRLCMLLQTDVKPRPIDGFAMENCFAQYGYGGNSGKEFKYESYEVWQRNIRSIMYMGELKVSARPLMMDGGIDNKKYASLPKERRHELFLYSYASYLMGVKVEDDGAIYTKLGFCPFVYQPDGNHYVEIDPCFQWDIGKPVETHNSKDYLKYKMEGRNVFVRRFENGIVLVNPTSETEKNISLETFGKDFINLDNSNKKVNRVTIRPHNGLILLKD